MLKEIIKEAVIEIMRNAPDEGLSPKELFDRTARACGQSQEMADLAMRRYLEQHGGGNIGRGPRFPGEPIPYIHEMPLPPQKISLSADFRWCSDEFRAEVNRWLLARFGRESSPLDGDRCYVLKEHGMIIAPHGMRERVMSEIKMAAVGPTND